MRGRARESRRVEVNTIEPRVSGSGHEDDSMPEVREMTIVIADTTRKIIRLVGEIDISNLGELRLALDQAVEIWPSGFVIDLSGTTYIDSGGIAAILSAYQRVCPEGELAVVIANRGIRDILSLVHLDQLPGFIICDTLTDAECLVISEIAEGYTDD